MVKGEEQGDGGGAGGGPQSTASWPSWERHMVEKAFLEEMTFKVEPEGGVDVGEAESSRMLGEDVKRQRRPGAGRS